MSALAKAFTRSFFVFVCVLGMGFSAHAAEVIRSFASDTELIVDGSVDVVETITVNAEGDKIKRGIFRDIPTLSEFDDGRKFRSDLNILSVKRDGRDEPFFVEDFSWGQRIYFGQENVFLDHGEYTYELHYTLSRIARSFDTFDELFWNATGNYWDFPIEQATAKITLPEGAIIGDISAYTGAFGENGDDATFEKISDNQVRFSSARVLKPYDGMSVSVSFQKGVLAEPSRAQGLLAAASDYRHRVFPIPIALFIAGYYLFFWLRVGKDPEKGTIIPLFHPPKEMSPALVHYVWAYGWKGAGWQAFSAAIVSLAVKGFVNIGEDGEKTIFELVDKENQKEIDLLPRGEKTIFDFLKTQGKVKIDKETGPSFDKARRDFVGAIEAENRRVYFNNNLLFTIGGLLLSVAAFAGMLIMGVLTGEVFMTSLLVCLAGILLFSVGYLWKLGGWRMFFPIGMCAFFAAGIIFMLVMLLPQIVGEVFSFGMLAIVIIITANCIFGLSMRAPTIKGRKIMDQIDGFRMYMETAEKERLNFQQEPELTTTRFEAILPYAIALGVEKPWAEHFEGELSRNTASGTRSDYDPHWSSRRFHSTSSFTKEISSMASGISSEMIAAQPVQSSSSGSSGGGSSGGGGGGGGGGGW